MVSLFLCLPLFYVSFDFLCRDPTTGWGSMNFPDFAAIFEVAAPYVPPASSSSSSSSSLSATDIAVIVVVVVSVVAIGVFLFTFCCGRRKQQSSPPAQAFAVDLPAVRGTPVTVVNPQVENPILATYAPPASSTRSG
jgi:hypothetical protein